MNILEPFGNCNVDRITISKLNEDKAEYLIHSHGDSGWGWNEYVVPPGFLNSYAANLIHLDRLKRHVGTCEFDEYMKNIFGVMIKQAFRVGFAFDSRYGERRLVRRVSGN